MQVREGQFSAGNDLVNRTEGSFHNAAGDTEDIGST